ncbi:type III secretion system HrpP C-terminal domain-containing protein [Lonsdalea quercina]|uniref:type III secretion system HrpP C-terminal domain-containing protein n=1 Tax=Lonsdalea quercina TaxID=71657 RepID=UPI003F4632CB
MSAYLPPAAPSSPSRTVPSPSAEKPLPRSRGGAAHSGDEATAPPSDFELLLSAPPVNFCTPGLASEDTGTLSSGLTLHAAADEVTTSLTETLHAELTARRDLASHSPFSFSLQLPQLGDVDVRMSTLPPTGWEVMLRFQRSAYQEVRRQRESCRRALSAALDCPIRLGFEVQEAS